MYMVLRPDNGAPSMCRCYYCRNSRVLLKCAKKANQSNCLLNFEYQGWPKTWNRVGSIINYWTLFLWWMYKLHSQLITHSIQDLLLWIVVTRLRLIIYLLLPQSRLTWIIIVQQWSNVIWPQIVADLFRSIVFRQWIISGLHWIDAGCYWLVATWIYFYANLQWTQFMLQYSQINRVWIVATWVLTIAGLQWWNNNTQWFHYNQLWSHYKQAMRK